MSGFPKLRGRVLVLAALSAAVFAYATVRAIRIPIVHDEATTYFQFVAGPWTPGPLDPRIPGPENNNLNAVLSVVAWKVFGGGDLALRLPNLLAYPLFLVATARLALRQSTAALSVAAFLLLNANAFAVEFFSLSRGYGLGLAFLASGVAFLVGALERPGHASIPASLGVLCLGLAAYAHLSFLLPLAACVAAGFAREAWRLVSRSRSPNPEPSSPSLLIPLSISLPFLLILVPYSMELSRKGHFHMGGVRGFWSNTVVSLLAVLRGRLPEDAPRAPLLEAAVVTAALFLVAAVLLPPRLLAPVALVPTVFLGLAAAGTELASRIFAARYPQERAALSLQFLFLAAGAGAGGEWVAKKRSGWRLVGAVMFVAAICGSAAFLRAANTTHTLTWRYDADNLRMLDDLDRARRERGFTRHVRLGITWLMEPSLNYYRVRRRLDWLLPVTRFRLAAQNPDFCYWTPKDDDDARAIGLVPLAVYPTSGNRFAARISALTPPRTPGP